jgi:hypothetical protein
MEPIGAKIQLKWDNGRVADMGTLKIRSEQKGTVLKTNIRIFRKRLGWELVRMGFRLMFPGRKWVHSYDRSKESAGEG